MENFTNKFNGEIRLYYDAQIKSIKESLCVENEVNCLFETEEKADEEGVYKDLGKWLKFTIGYQRKQLQKIESDVKEMLTSKNKLAEEIIENSQSKLNESTSQFTEIYQRFQELCQ